MSDKSNLITVTITLTFDPTNCEDVSAEDYDPEVDIESICEFGSDHYNLVSWEIKE